jgi:hypothetical protein
MITALDAHPRRCMFCADKIHLCMGFVLARDILPIMQASLEGRPLPLIKVRELCGRCVFVWNRIANEDYAGNLNGKSCGG